VKKELTLLCGKEALATLKSDVRILPGGFLWKSKRTLQSWSLCRLQLPH